MKKGPEYFRSGTPDPEREIPVRIGGAHRGLVVWHSRAELERYWRGVDRQASEALARPDPRRRPVDPNECQEGC